MQRACYSSDYIDFLLTTGGRDSSVEVTSNIEELLLHGGLKKEKKGQFHFWGTYQLCTVNTKC